jgi:Ser/Thr protein kinase RdoA (MazF antagonist)
MKPFESLTHRGQILRLRRLALKALERYELPAFRLTALQHEENTTFRVDLSTGERYALRIHRFANRSKEAVHSELLWLVALRREGFVVPEPLLTRDRQLLTVITLEGVPAARISVLFHWVDGEFLNRELTPAHLEQVGAFMARLHKQSIHFKTAEGFVRERVDVISDEERNKGAHGMSEQDARQQFDHPDDEAMAIRVVAQVASAEDGARVETLIRKMRAVQRALGQGPETFGLIHADLHQDNYLFLQESVRAIDFDDCGFGHYLYDMAVTLSEVKWRENTPALHAAFLTGYRSVHPLSAEHQRYLETFIAFRGLQMLIMVIGLRNHPRFQDRWEKTVRRMVNNLKDFVEKEP